MPLVGPGKQFGAAVGSHHRTCRVVMSRRQEDGVCLRRTKRLDRDAAAVDGEWHRRQPVPEDRSATIGVAWILDRDPSTAARLDELRHEVDGLGETVAHDDVVRVGGGATDPVEVGSQRPAQLRRAPPVEVGQALARRLDQHATHRAQPDLTREQRDVRAPVREVDPDGGRRLRRSLW